MGRRPRPNSCGLQARIFRPGSRIPQPQQRFMLDTTCHDKCILEVETPEGQKAGKELGEFRLGKSEIKVAGGTVHVDSTTVKSDPFVPTRIEELCNRLRISIMTRY